MASAQNHGTATYYTPPYIPSACYGFADQGVMIAAASEAIWNGGGACGQGTPNPCQGSSSVVVKIVDLCPAGSCRGTIDLSQEAFASIADTACGVINISYQ
ncbi:hypothetical protein CICLE_v10010585mg, partial [Citrus x clementina]